MSGEIGVIGYGAVGAATVERLAAAGRAVVVAQRQAPANLPAGVEFRPLRRARRGLACARRSRAVAGRPGDRLSLCRRGVARGVAAHDDEFRRGLRGRRRAPGLLRQPLHVRPADGAAQRNDAAEPFGVKPAARVAATRIWMAASEAGRLRVAALRAPDFYGPGALLSHLGDTAFGALARGGRATFIGSPDTPHDFAYVPDCARAVVSLLDAPDDAYGQAWHVPCAPTRTPREILALGAAAIGVAPTRDRPADRRSSARSACSCRRCANSPKCASSGTGPTASTRAASPRASGPTRRRSRSARRRLRGGFATAPAKPSG